MTCDIITIPSLYFKWPTSDSTIILSLSRTKQPSLNFSYGAASLGVAEFDTVGKTFVANHDILVGTGYGSEPYASPDGKYILLMPHDGGKYVRVMRPGKNGVPSVSGQLVIPFLHKGIIPTCFSF